ncbi:hypothetical protein H8S37_07185 [Mediterraneibacter sp. NSJ-55]|uniref:Uncharacterized protein n=1 Tax=Mediterraneibacter hominis TaxID=2763054 RepID=A0A923LI56_9FIRM|nr:hypothetical protein [Mediterraneibacter hominis]MBC5688714.1 hypothetical protein [Mediterraneibacter hominis]
MKYRNNEWTINSEKRNRDLTGSSFIEGDFIICTGILMKGLPGKELETCRLRQI